MFPALKKNNAAAGYQGPVIKELLKCVGLLFDWAVWLIKLESLFLTSQKQK